ncbi:hypothetical protein MTO96_030254 [Rhipicephalus appendiculatus]
MQVPPACRCLGDEAAVRSPWQPPRPPDTRGDSGGRERRRRSERLGEESAGILSSQSGRCPWEWLPQRACEGSLCWLQCSTVRARRQPRTPTGPGCPIPLHAAQHAGTHRSPQQPKVWHAGGRCSARTKARVRPTYS